MARYHRQTESTLKKKLLISATSFVATVLLLEVVLRIGFSPYITQIYEINERCLFRPKAGTSHYCHYVPPNTGPNILVRVNDDGYRGPNRAPAEAATKVAVFGDSFIMAECSPWEDTFCVQLERELEAALGKPAFVVNAGLPGGGPDQYLPRLADELPRLVPDLVIVAIYAGNDFGDLMRNKMFRIDANGDVVPNEFTLSDKVRERFSIGDSTAIYRMVHWLRTEWRNQRGWASMEEHTEEGWKQLAHTIADRDLGLCRNDYHEYVELGRNDVRALLDDYYDSDLALEPQSKSARYKVRLMEGVIERIKAAVGDVPLLLVAIPAPNDVIENYRNGSADKQKYPEYRESRLTGELVRIAGSHDVPCVDLFEPFRARGADMYLIAPDIHWSAAGQRAAAELVRAKILEERLLER